MFLVTEAEQMVTIAMQDSRGGNHFGVQQYVFRKQAQEKSGMPIRTVHHRRYTEAPPDC
jgi:hypothetical protein